MRADQSAPLLLTASIGDSGTPLPISIRQDDGAAEDTVIEQTTWEGGWMRQPLKGVPTIFGEPITNGIVLAGIVLLLAVLAGILYALHRKKEPAQRETTAVDAETAVFEDTMPVSSSDAICVAYHQDIGARRDQQDSCVYADPACSREKGMLAVVADGMGGLANGKAVSSLLVRVFDEGFRRAPENYDAGELLLRLAATANTQVSRQFHADRQSGSTLVAALIKNGYLHFLSVGDSRIYLYRAGGLIQLTREHVFREELALRVVNQTAAVVQLRQDSQAGSLTSFFGDSSICALDRNATGIKLIAGDKILLASDGVFGTLSDAQLESALSGDVRTAADTIGAMIRAANKPGQDNNTAVILEYRG